MASSCKLPSVLFCISKFWHWCWKNNSVIYFLSLYSIPQSLCNLKCNYLESKTDGLFVLTWGHSMTTWTQFCPILAPTYLHVDIFNPKRGQKWHLLDHLPPLLVRVVIDLFFIYFVILKLELNLISENNKSPKTCSGLLPEVTWKGIHPLSNTILLKLVGNVDGNLVWTLQFLCYSHLNVKSFPIFWTMY